MVALAGSAAAAPPGLPDENPNKNSYVVPVTCEGVNNDESFLIWIPNGKAFDQTAVDTVGHPIGVDVPIGVGKNYGQGAAARAITCETLIGPVLVMPTGKP